MRKMGRLQDGMFSVEPRQPRNRPLQLGPRVPSDSSRDSQIDMRKRPRALRLLLRHSLDSFKRVRLCRETRSSPQLVSDHRYLGRETRR